MAGKSNKKALVPAEKPLDGEILPPVDKVEAKVNEPTAEMHSAIDKAIRDGFAAYFAGKQAAHLSAVAAIMWAAKYGDARYLNVGFDLCGGFGEKPTADAENLRSWAGRISTYTGSDGKEAKWLGFNTKATEGRKAGFFVKSGLAPAAAREAMDELSLKQGPRFMDNIAKMSKPLSLEDVLRLISKFPDTVKSKEKKVVESGSVPLPASLVAKLMEASAEATMLSAHVAPVAKTA